MLETMVQFGVAGLMGVLWVWERTYSRRRERQLSEAHAQLMQCDQQVWVLVRLVRQNTRAMTELQQSQQRMNELLEGIRHEMATDHRAA